MTVVFKHKRHFLLLSVQLWKAPSLHSTAQPRPAPSAGRIWSLTGTFPLSGNWPPPPSTTPLFPCKQQSCDLGTQRKWLFLETNSLRGVKRATNLSSLAVNHEEKQRRHFKGILSDCGETDWPTEYTNTAVHRVLKGWNWFFNSKL